MSSPESAAPVLAVDGPSGSGKGTICRQVAERMGWRLLDSGALYRLTAVAASKHGVDLDDGPGVARLAAELDVEFATDADGGEQVWLEGRDVTGEIRTETCGNAASILAAIPMVRAALVGLQHRFRRPPGLVADGRDMGTVIFPDATAKVFLTASPEARAERRYKQLIEKGFDANLRSLCTEIAERDERDARREASPLKAADDALVIDTTTMSIGQVVRRVHEHLQDRLAKNLRKDGRKDGMEERGPD
ncbi:MAG: (d)CMP kinase [Gammaproteobacteria bacterium]